MTARDDMGKLVLVLIVVAGLYIALEHDKGKDKAANDKVTSEPYAQSPASEADDSEPSSRDVASNSGGWGEGHQAGYDWAEEKGIDDDDACEEAGEHSNSPSFAEGCKAYVDEQR